MKLNNLQVLSKVDTPYLVSVLEKCMSINKLCNSIIVELTPYMTKEVEYTTDEGYAVLSTLEEIVDVDYKDLQKFYEGNVSGNPAMIRRVRDFLYNYSRALDYVDEALGPYVPLTFEELNRVYVLLGHALGHLCIFIRSQFEFSEYVEDGVLDYVLEVYLKNNSLTKEDAARINADLKLKAEMYRPKIAVFDKYPEYEESFFDIVGEEFYDLEYLDVKQVVEVIEGKLSPEGLLEAINNAK